MKKITSISRLATFGIAAGGFWLIGTVNAQTSVADNPHLRHADTKPGPAKPMTDKDKNFILKAASGGQQEVENGMAAENRAQDAATKMVAKRMVTDHTRANKELVALAKDKGLGVTTDNIKAQNIKSANFDKQYLADLKHYHQEDITSFQKEAKDGDDPEIKTWATKMLPTLKAHLAMVEDTIKKMK